MGLMAAADLPAIQLQGSTLGQAMTFVVGAGDEWVPERPLRAVIESPFPLATVERWEGGHPLHEEDPDRAAAFMRAWLAQHARQGTYHG